MARISRRWPTIDDAELLALVARADDRAFTEFVSRYVMPVAMLASRVLGTLPPTELSVAIFSRIRALADESPKDSASVRDWVLTLALDSSLEYRRGTSRDYMSIDEDERRKLKRQIEDNADLIRRIEDSIAHHTMTEEPMPRGRVGSAKGRYIMTLAFDEPLSEFEEYE
jgi:hypothetical protein